jgi:hypothetical protein
MKNVESFLVKINTNDELINSIIELNKIGALGSKISYGTYLPDSYSVSDIINKKINIEVNQKYDNSICALSISYDNDEYRNNKFPHLYGKNHILISLTTLYDIKIGDVPKTIISYNDMINETLKLINCCK